MNDLNYEFVLMFVIILYACFGASFCVEEMAEQKKVGFFKFLLVLLAIPIIIALITTFFGLHAFCFELYNALQANDITIEQLVESAK